MKTLFGASITLVLLGAGQATAADGCPDGSLGFVTTPDNQTVTTFFPGVTATVGDPTVCNVSVPVVLPADTIGIYTANYAVVFVATPDNDPDRTATLTVVPQYAPGYSTTQGPDDFVYGNLLGGGLDGTVDAQISLSVAPGPAPLLPPDAYLDTLDMVLLATTTFSSQQGSIDRLAQQRAGVITHLGGTADQLLGWNQPVDAPDSVSAFGSVGSYTFGATGHMTVTDGFSLQGGAAYTSQSTNGADVSGPLFAASARYVLPEAQVLRPFAEAGFWGSPSLAMRFTRRYETDTGTTTASVDTTGSLLSAFGRAGLLYDFDEANELAFSGVFAQNWLNVGAYDEPAGPNNYFAAHTPAGTTSSSTVKATVAWTSEITPEVDVTLSAAAGRSFGNSPLVANVDWVGPVTGNAGDFNFVEYGARAGWKLTADTSIEAFVHGTTGENIGTHVEVGGAFRLQF